MMQLLLPNELLVLVFNNLDFRTLLTSTEVCKQFRDLIVGTASLQYIIELAVSGQRDGPYISGMSSVTNLKRLRIHQEAWKNVSWSREIEIPMLDGDTWELCGGVLGQTTAEGGFHFYRLPSDLRGIQEARWTLEPRFEFRVCDFTMDPGQDLLVLVESPVAVLGSSKRDHRLHLRSLSSGKPHPLAEHAILSLPQFELDLDVDYSMQVYGDIVGAHICPMTRDDNDVALWNWKTGELLVDIYSPELDSFSLLSNRWMVIAITENNDEQPCLRVIDFAAEAAVRKNIAETKTGRRFEYPAFCAGTYIYDIHIRADPGSINQADTGTPFYQDAKEFLLTVTMQVGSLFSSKDKYIIHCIPSSHLLSEMDRLDAYYENHQSGQDSSLPHPESVEWNLNPYRLLCIPEWSQPSVMLVPCYNFGSKVVLPERTTEENGGFSARLYDFNQLALRKDGQKSICDEPTRALDSMQTKEDTIEDIFLDDINTALPYRHSLLSLMDAHDHCKVMCHQDCIVVLDAECRKYRVLVF